MLHNINGIQIREDPSLVEHKQFRFPKSKKKRIQKKWLKKTCNWKTIIDRNVYMLNTHAGRIAIAHPTIIKKLKLKTQEIEKMLKNM